jgi:membrane protein implicated in regulation of membrane protease activity
VALLSLLATGAVILFGIFTLVAGVSPADAALATAVAAALSVLLLLRSVRREYEFRSQGGDPQLRSSYNEQRERRGF